MSFPTYFCVLPKRCWWPFLMCPNILPFDKRVDFVSYWEREKHRKYRRISLLAMGPSVCWVDICTLRDGWGRGALIGAHASYFFSFFNFPFFMQSFLLQRGRRFLFNRASYWKLLNKFLTLFPTRLYVPIRSIPR